MIYFILVNPQLPENIGMTIRAMANSDMKYLRLVGNNIPWPHEKASATAVGAESFLDDISSFPTLESALEDIHISYATTCRTREMTTPVIWLDEATKDVQSFIEQKLNVAIVFGPERIGLNNDEVSLCNKILEIPLAGEFKSLNLSQAVLLVAYHLQKIASYDCARPQDMEINSPATQKELHYFLYKLESFLDESHHFPTAQKKPNMIRSIKSFFERAAPSTQEVRSLLGVINSLYNKNN